MKFLRLMPGKGEIVLAEGDPELTSEQELLIEEFRRQLDEGMWAAVPIETGNNGRREAIMVQDFSDIPRDAERVIFFPARRAAEPPGPARVWRCWSQRWSCWHCSAYLGVQWRVRLLARRRAAEPRARSPQHPASTPASSAAPSARRGRCCESIVNREDWEMYRDLGFIRVAGRMARARRPASYCYLIYPHQPIVAYLPEIEQPAERVLRRVPRPRRRRTTAPRLPDSDDVLAKWMMIKADEERLMRGANMHLPGTAGRSATGASRPLDGLREWERQGGRASGARGRSQLGGRGDGVTLRQRSTADMRRAQSRAWSRARTARRRARISTRSA